MTEFIDTPIGSLVSGELRWKDYINSLTPEDIEKQRLYDRARLKKWYQENKEKKQEYCKEYYQKNKDRKREQAREYYRKKKDQQNRIEPNPT